MVVMVKCSFCSLLCTISMMFTSSACMGVASIQKLVNHKGLCNEKKPVVSRPNILSKPNYKMLWNDVLAAKVNIFSSTLSLTCFLNIFEILENIQGRFPIKSSINPLSICQVNLFKPLVPIFAWKELLSLQMINYAFPLRSASPCATTMLGNWDSYLSGDALITQKRVTPKFIV